MSNVITEFLSKSTGRNISNVDLVNTVRKYGSDTLKEFIPELEEGRTLKSALAHKNVPYSNFEVNKNEFLDILINRIGSVVVRSSFYENPLDVFRSQDFTYGETLQELFTAPVEGKQYDGKATKGVFDIYNAKTVQFFHDLNNERVYPISIEYNWTAKAFTSEEAFDQFINGRMQALTGGDKLDEIQALKGVLTNALTPTHVDDPAGVGADLVIPGTKIDKTQDNWLTKFARELNKRSRLFALSSKDHTENAIKIPKATPIAEQYLIISAEAQTDLDFMQANAFNMDKSAVLTRTIVIDDFPEYTGAGDLNGAKPFAMLVSKDSIIFKDKMKNMTTQMDPLGLKTNVFYHHHYMTSFSLIENAHVFYTQD